MHVRRLAPITSIKEKAVWPRSQDCWHEAILYRMRCTVNDRNKPVNASYLIYVPNVGGVRIEDDVVLTKQGVDMLTTFKRELIVR